MSVIRLICAAVEIKMRFTSLQAKSDSDALYLFQERDKTNRTIHLILAFCCNLRGKYEGVQYVMKTHL